MTITSFLACRESWGDKKLPDCLLYLKSQLCFGLVKPRQPVSKGLYMAKRHCPLSANSILRALGSGRLRGHKPEVPYPVVCGWEVASLWLIFQGFVVASLGTGKQK